MDKMNEELKEAAEKYGSDFTAYNNNRFIAEHSFITGAEWHKAQMIKDAMETTIIEGSLDNPTFIRRKIIIVKEEEK